MRWSGLYPRLATYGPKVVSRRRPAGSVSELTQPSVTNTASAGVFADTQRAAARSRSREHLEVRGRGPGGDEQRRRHAEQQHDRDRRQRPAADEPRGEQGDRDPHRLEVLVHVEVDDADLHDVRDHEEADDPRGQEAAMRHARQEQRGQRQRERHAEVGEVEEGDRGRAVGRLRRRPARDELQPARAGGLERGRHDERHRQEVRREQDQRVARGVPVDQPPAGDDPRQRQEREDGEEEEVERRQQRAEQPGQPDQPRAVAPAGGRRRAVGSPATSSRIAPTSIGRPAVVARWASRPVPITDGMRKFGGDGLSHWLS